MLRDFDNETKFSEHIDLVVCWKASGRFTRKLLLKPFLLGGAGNERVFYGSTHQAFLVGQFAQPVFEVVILEDLINYLRDPEGEQARQKVKYEMT